MSVYLSAVTGKAIEKDADGIVLVASKISSVYINWVFCRFSCSDCPAISCHL